MSRVHFNIGSNLGDRLANIGRAVALLEYALKTPAACSTPFVSTPWGYDSPNDFINVGASFSTDLDPSALLGIAHATEREIDPDGHHRNADGSYADRIIDIDIICVDDCVSESDPVLPHPRLHLREFVVVPLLQLMPDWIHPLLKLTPGEMLANLHNKQS